MKEQVEERLRFYDEGIAPTKNITAMQVRRPDLHELLSHFVKSRVAAGPCMCVQCIHPASEASSSVRIEVHFTRD